MTDYIIEVGHSGRFCSIREEDETPTIIYNPDSDVVWMVEKDENTSVTKHSPTQRFWKSLVYIEEVTGRMAEHRSHAESLSIEHSLPPLDSYQHMDSPSLPKYESNLCFVISNNLFRKRVETKTVFEDYPRLRKLFHEAYQNCDEAKDTPYYLEDRDE